MRAEITDEFRLFGTFYTANLRWLIVNQGWNVVLRFVDFIQFFSDIKELSFFNILLDQYDFKTVAAL